MAVLLFGELEGSHSGENIAKHVYELIKEYHIEVKASYHRHRPVVRFQLIDFVVDESDFR